VSTLDEWADAACRELGLDPASLDVKVVLDLARDVAHGVARPAAPLTAYLLGVAVGQGRPPAESAARSPWWGDEERLAAILAELGHVAEGVSATVSARELARRHGVDMPIVDAVHRVLYSDLSPRDAVLALLAREPRAEGE